MSPRPPARRLVTAPPLELVAPDPMGGQALPPLPSQRLPPAFVSIRCKGVGQKSLFWRLRVWAAAHVSA